MSTGSLSRRRFDDLRTSVSRFDSVISGMTTAVMAVIMIVLPGGRLDHQPRFQESGQGGAGGDDRRPATSRKASSRQHRAGDLPEELPNREQEVMTDPRLCPTSPRNLNRSSNNRTSH